MIDLILTGLPAKILLIIGILYALFLGGLYVAQSAMLFPAPPFDEKLWNNLPDFAQQAKISTDDDTVLNCILVKAVNPKANIIFFHGNGSSSLYELSRAKQLQDAGFNVLLAEYRGYSGSGGKPSAQAMLKDSIVIYDWLDNQTDKPISLYAHSLGTGAATYLASKREVTSLVLEAPYNSLTNLVASKFWYIPVKALFRHEIASENYIKLQHAPVLFIHGAQDTLIPAEFGKKLFDAANDPKSWLLVPDAGHNNLVFYGSLERAINFFNLQLNG